MWSGQEYDRWRVEVEKWFDNNKATDEEKYIDLLESFNKNEAVNDFDYSTGSNLKVVQCKIILYKYL